MFLFFFLQAEDGIRDLVRSRGLGDVYKRQEYCSKPETLKKVATYVNAMDFYNSEMEKVAA